MKEVKINISNRGIYTLTSIGILIIASWVVFAFGGNQPSVVGHTWNETECSGCIDTTNVKDNSITAVKIADNTITDNKIVEVSWSKITGAPSMGGTVTLTNCETIDPPSDHDVWYYCSGNKVVHGLWRDTDGSHTLYCCSITIS